ncbi:MAG: LysR family transcriptional regulator [Deltaproteobacteria bacterium]|nr:LysR family transcriptional regulator [Deltaproteobacteria bacterium]
MDRLYSLYQHWSWLPHFRAIAETQHLGAAARLLRVTPPAMSRALQNLEGALGTKLFDRRGRNVVLNDAGGELLVAVRNAMRHLDDAVQRVSTTREHVRVRVSAPGPYYGAVVLPALARTRTTWPELRIDLVDAPAAVALALMRGEVDVCLHEHAVANAEVEVEPISRVQKVVACARTHPASRRRNLHVRDLLDYEFVGPPASPEGVRNDGWPATVPRRVELTVSNMQLGVDAAASGGYLAVLPAPIATGSHLTALKVRGLAIPTTQIYVSRRRPLATTADTTSRVIGLLRDQLQRREAKR